MASSSQYTPLPLSDPALLSHRTTSRMDEQNLKKVDSPTQDHEHGADDEETPVVPLTKLNKIRSR